MTTIIKTNETLKENNLKIKNYIKEGFSSLAKADDNGNITVVTTSGMSGWGKHNSIENAAFIIGRIKEDFCGLNPTIEK